MRSELVDRGLGAEGRGMQYGPVDTIKILVIEDDAVLSEALRYNFDREGYNTLIAGDGVIGLELARAAQPDLIILDVMLPRLDGFSICRILRQESEVPIIMLTARSDEMDRINGL